jgi:hypothetical protein
MENIIKKSSIIIANKGVKLVSDEKSLMGLIFDVKTKNLNQVRIYQRNGKILINCGCENSVRYGVNKFNICKHKLSVIMYIWQEKLFEKFNPLYHNIFLKAFEILVSDSIIQDNKFLVNGKELVLIEGKYTTWLNIIGEKEPELTPERIAVLLKIVKDSNGK